MLDLNEAMIFAKVVEMGGFIAAARHLSMPKATVSRKVQDLEARLGTRLLNRTTRRVSLTEAGATFYDHCAIALREFDEAELAVGTLQAAPRGVLRVVAPFTLSDRLMQPWLQEFMRLHPEIRLALILTNDDVDLVERNIDVRIQAGLAAPTGFVRRTLARFGSGLYAAPQYVARHGMPTQVEDLARHAVLTMSKFEANGRFVWPLVREERGHYGATTPVEVTPVMSCNDPSAVISGTLAGLGIGLFSEVGARMDLAAGRLVQVLPDWHLPPVEVSLVFPSRRGLSPKVRVFVDFMVERFAALSTTAAEDRRAAREADLLAAWDE